MKKSTHIGIGELKNLKTALSETPKKIDEGKKYLLKEEEEETVSLISQTFLEAKEPESDEDGQLSIDVFQNPKEIILIAPCAGVKKDEIQISLTEETLSIKGIRKIPLRKEGYEQITNECFWGKFSRHIVLPKNIDRSAISADIKNNVLIINIPKVDDASTKLIKIR